MSQYLLDRISATANIVVRCQSEVVAARGEEHLEAVTIADRERGVSRGVSGVLVVRLHRRLTAYGVARPAGGP